MKAIVFDAGPIISLALNNLLWLLEPLKKQSKANFYITEAVKRELIDNPLKIKRFKFEALQTMQFLKSKTIEVVSDGDTDNLTTDLLELANHCFKARGEWIKLLHYAEVQSLAYSILKKADAFVVDERTTRLLIEDHEKLRKTMKRKLKTEIYLNEDYLKRFQNKVKGLRMIRSVELIVMAYEMGLLDRYLPDIPEPNKFLLDSVLWGLKLNGCSVSNREIDQIIKIEKK